MFYFWKIRFANLIFDSLLLLLQIGYNSFLLFLEVQYLKSVSNTEVSCLIFLIPHLKFKPNPISSLVYFEHIRYSVLFYFWNIKFLTRIKFKSSSLHYESSLTELYVAVVFCVLFDPSTRLRHLFCCTERQRRLSLDIIHLNRIPLTNTLQVYPDTCVNWILYTNCCIMTILTRTPNNLGFVYAREVLKFWLVCKRSVWLL